MSIKRKSYISGIEVIMDPGGIKIGFYDIFMPLYGS
jgi:hypothetical protein